MIDLVKKYDVPVPRYTSYPTVPAWDVNSFQLEEYKGWLKASFQQTKEEGISLYLHLPYCESLCTYCGCNTRITINHKVELPYIESLLKEWKLYLDLFGEKPLVREIHLGGGTPTFFSPENLRYLMESILDTVDVHPDYQFSFEGHPNNTTYEHLVALYEVGFTRVSYGVQDVDFKVQKAINRLQPLENIEKVTKAAREIGYTSVNFDLIYGLPFQTIYGIKQTMDVVKTFMPDRIAFYSYAHVPWVKPGQRAYSEENIPQGEEKHKLNMLGQALLLDMGYQAIGMDHFALPEDPLCQARSKGRLHRNFMGYTESRTNFMIGLGVSSISDIGVAYAQNVKSVEGYRAKVEAGELPMFKGHLITVPEMEAKQLILDIACSARIQMRHVLELNSEKYTAFNQMADEGLIERFCLNYQVTKKGMMFLRNICALFDDYYEPQSGNKLFSQAV
ncbi:coproporphyrinogen III oxidase [Roseivirga seohaensis]|uniref:Coproporphyrinogen-III oxidase n=1 Tax=Roseivirga seohaensis TaxID=1914963 RepID=A0A150Y402_9BACT|nr:oxygen-independent coproporphyrinogen III oxidase [Roseivirga seohaensis]KYG85759.1 coproporphyrinogen III oxidase [Roseivirga seohaensis]